MDGWMDADADGEGEGDRTAAESASRATHLLLSGLWLASVGLDGGRPCLTGHHQPSRACLYLTADHHPSRSPAVRAWIITARGTARWDKHATRSSVHASMR